MNKLFFEIIQLALGNRSALSKNPTKGEWYAVFDIARKQAVTGVIIQALDKLSKQGQKPPYVLLLEWIGLSEQIRSRNSLLNTRCLELQHYLSDRNIKTSILKGQGVATYYDKGLQLLRQSGDIDVYVDCGRKRAIELAEELHIDKVHWDYKHLQLQLWEGVEIEVHYRVEVLFNLRKNKRLQRWFKEHEKWLFDQKEGLIKPNVQFDLFYVLLHIYRHFLHEGVGMRQVIDYYYVLKAGIDHNKKPLQFCANLGCCILRRG